MRRITLVIAFSASLAAPLAGAQQPVFRSPGGEIKIPAERTLEREAVKQPRNEFSTNDATATRQMEPCGPEDRP
jgi:hypothetical protein